jgi:uncharacterized protein (DUF488 family)
METREFQEAVDRLIETASGARTAVMCAESVWWRCHRRMLADVLVARGCGVRHTMEGGRQEAHRLSPEARLVDGDLVYDVPSGQASILEQ